MPDFKRLLVNTGQLLVPCSLPFVVFALLYACSKPQMSQLDRIKKRGELIVVTRNGPTSYYIEKNSQTGVEYELAKKFADGLGVRLKTIVARNIADVVTILKTNRADLAAAALINNQDNNNGLVYGPGFQWVTQQLVYRNGQRRPSSLDDISPDKLDLATDTLTFLPDNQLKTAHSNLSWKVHNERDSNEMLELLENREIQYTIADSNELTLARQYYPEIRVAFNVSPPQPVAWAFRKNDDLSLLQAVWRFYEKISNDGELANLIKQFYGPMEKFDYVDSRKFVDRFDKRFPQYQTMFEEVAGKNDLDWRLVAAVSYQESHWKVNAVSPTGVRGLMMLTRDTAKTMGVDNRLDPEQSVRGGTRYLKTLIRKIPERIPEPDRTWMAVAAYNVGFGHLEDARILTEKQGADPDNWLEVKQRLPLLSRKQWYKQTKNGYARGVEPVLFVERVRKYYNTLVQLTQPDMPYFKGDNEQLVETVIVDSPVL